jgi:hypothetical protein
MTSPASLLCTVLYLRVLGQVFVAFLYILARYVFSVEINNDFSCSHCRFCGFPKGSLDLLKVLWIS